MSRPGLVCRCWRMRDGMHQDIGCPFYSKHWRQVAAEAAEREARIAEGDRVHAEVLAGASVYSETIEMLDDFGPRANRHLCVGSGGYQDHDGEWRDCAGCMAGR